MFGRSNQVKWKAAEDAVAEGRIDAAFEFVAALGTSDGQRARDVRGQLGEAFLTRGQEHLMGRRFAPALADFERAGRCGLKMEQVRAWQDRAMKAMDEAERGKRTREEAVGMAQRRLESGSLAGAAAALADLRDGDPDGRRLGEAIARQQERAAAALADARAAMTHDDVLRAVRQYRCAAALDGALDGLAEVEAALVTTVVDRAASHFEAGRLSRADQELAQLGDIGRTRAVRCDLEDALGLARDASRAIAEGQYARAGVMIRRMVSAGREPAWLAEARQAIERMDADRRSLMAGPLGSRHAEVDAAATLGALSVKHRGAGSAAETVAAGAIPEAPPVIRATEAPRNVTAPPKRMVMRIDGVGSFMLLSGERISIGRAGPDGSADVQLVSDLSDRQAEIVRSGDDYFIMAASGVELAGRPVEHALLQDGDRIRLGRRVRLTFRRPSLKSAAAVLDLGDGVRMVDDCRRILLWGGPLLVGGRRECHVVLRNTADGGVFTWRDGQLIAKPMGPVGRSFAVSMGTPFEIAGTRMSLQVLPGSSGGRVMG